jgi:DNA-binding NarL/FixJ family response regulator
MIKITVAETQPVYAEGIIKILSQSMGLQLHHLTHCYQGLLSFLKDCTTDLLLLDAELNCSLPEEKFISCIKKEFPNLKIILFGKTANLSVLPKLRRVGLDGYLTKNISAIELQKAIFTIMGGSGYLQESLSAAFNHFSTEIVTKQKKSENKITKREQQILGMIIEEYTNQEIAEELFISLPTVETHRKHLILKLGVKNTAGLVREAILTQWYDLFHHGFP